MIGISTDLLTNPTPIFGRQPLCLLFSRSSKKTAAVRGDNHDLWTTTHTEAQGYTSRNGPNQEIELGVFFEVPRSQLRRAERVPLWPNRRHANPRWAATRFNRPPKSIAVRRFDWLNQLPTPPSSKTHNLVGDKDHCYESAIH